MKSIINHAKLISIFFAIGFTFLIVNTVTAQDQIEWFEGVLNVKITPEAKANLDFEKSGDVQLTGIQTLDMLAQQFNVREIEQIFVTDPRFAERHRAYGLDRWYRVHFDSSADGEEVANLFSMNPNIEIAERESKRYLIGAELNTEDIIDLLNFDDPRLDEQWHYNNTGQTGGTAGADINLFPAWAQETGSQDVIVKVMDSGIDVNHPDLNESLWQNPNSGPENGYDGDVHGWNFVTGTSDIQDQNGHGSHTSGTIAARSNNGVGVAGIAGGDENGPGVQIMVARVFSGFGDTPGGFPEGFVYGADNGAVISNNSWGGGSFSQVLNDAITYFIETAGYDADENPVGPIQGGIVFFAAGNANSGTPNQPIASNPDVIAVAATNHNDQKAWYSSYGNWVHLAAPGGETAFSNDPEGVLSPVIGGYAFYQGTSMASPHAAGLAALIASKFPGLTNDEVYERMYFTADEIDEFNPNFEGQLGVRINAGRALEEDDGIPPADITDLATVGHPAENFVTLTWTAPGSSDMEGQAFSYDLRMSTSPIDAGNFEDAEQIEAPRPALAGTTEVFDVTDLTPQTTYYFAVRARDFFENYSNISNVVEVTTDGSPQIDVNPTQLSAEVEVGETEEHTITITNTGEGLLTYAFPSYVTDDVLTSESLAPLKSMANPADELQMENLRDRGIIEQYLAGNIDNPTAHQRTIIDEFERTNVGQQNPSNPGLLSGDSVLLEFEGLTAAGDEFFLVNDADYTGELSSVVADFVLDSATGGTWANDLAVLFTTTDEISESTVVLQVGGLTNYGPTGTRIPWGTGSSGSAGTPVNTTLEIDDALDVEGLYVWVGQGWSSGGESTWTGTIDLVGISDGPKFISSLTPASGSIAVGESVDVTAVFDATEVVEGVYESSTALLSNDLGNPNITIEFLLQTAGGIAVLESSVDELDFGNVFQNNSKTLSFSISNTGTAIADVEQILVSNSVFEIDDDSAFLLGPGSSKFFEVTFTPDQIAAYNENVTFVSNSEDGDVVVTLAGSGTEVPAIALDPDTVEAILAGGETGSETFQIVNEGDGPLDFSIPAFLEEMIFSGENANVISRKAELDRSLQDLQVAMDRNVIARYLSGELNNPSDAQQQVIEEYQRMLSAERTIDSPGLMSDTSVLLEFEELTATGDEFFLFNDGDFSGEMTAVVADFVIDAASGGTWANDLAVLFTTSDEEISEETVVLQVGGLTVYGPSGSRIAWGTGSSGTPGTPVNTTIELTEPLDMDGLYVWIGQGWSSGGESTWTGSIELMDVADTPGFVTNVYPASGSVPAGDSQTITVDFDATGLLGGTYEAEVAIHSNDPVNPVVNLTALLNVTGNVAISVDPESLDFGNVFEGQSEERMLAISNDGNGVLEVSDISSDNTDFTTDVSELSVAPFSTEYVTVTYTASSIGESSGQLSISSNDAENAVVTVDVTGTGIDVPAIVLNPDTVEATLEGGETGSETFQIVNEGDGPLDFSIPAFLEEMIFSGENANVISRKAELDRSLQDLQVAMDRNVIARYLSGELNNPSDAQQQVIEEYQRMLSAERTVDSPGLMSDTSVLLEFEELTADSDEFFLFNDGDFSGEMTAVVADFVIDAASGGTWANDLAVLFTTSDEEISEETVVLQVGGLTVYGPSGSRIAWGTGSSGTPGTPVATTIELDEPLDMDGLYVWIGHGWTSGGESTWSGSIELMDVADTPGFVTNVYPASGSVPAGDSQTITVDFDATGLLGGTYEAEVAIHSNDPVNPVVNLTALLNVTGNVAISVDPESLDFGNVFEGETEGRYITITNSGNGVLEVTDISSDNADFSADVTELSVGPFSSESVLVSFTPSSVGEINGELTISSNDADNPELAVSLTGNGVDTPEISVSPEQISSALNTGETDVVEFTITNTGAGPLDFALPAFISNETLTVDNTSALRTTVDMPITDELLKEFYNRKSQANVYSAAADRTRSAADRPRLNNDPSITLEFEDLALNGLEFVLVNEADYSGELSSLVADFVLDAATGWTWASDLAVVFTTEEEINEDTVVLQVGGTSTLGAAGTRIPWDTGNSSEPGTPVDITIELEEALDVEDLYVWIGMAWIASDTGTWTGSVELVGVSDAPAFITDATPASGTIAAGDSETISVTFDATGMFGGVYEAEIAIASNDPVTPMYMLPAVLDVTGVPQISVEPDALDFGTIFSGETNTLLVTVTNTGTDLLEVSSVSSDEGAFVADQSSFDVGIGESQAVQVAFMPDAAGSYSGTLTIESNAVSDPEVLIELSGEAVDPPVIVVDDTGFTWSLNSNQTASETLVIENDGASDLILELSDIDGHVVGVTINAADGTKRVVEKQEFESPFRVYQQAGMTKSFESSVLQNVNGREANTGSGASLMEDNGLEVIFYDDFESYDDFVLEYGDWTLVDADGLETYGFTGITFPNSGEPMASIIFNPGMTSPPLDSPDGAPLPGMTKYAASFAAIPDGGVYNDDWMITPMVQLGFGSSVSFQAKTFVPDYGLERFRVGVSTTGTNPEDFTIISEEPYETAPANEWTPFTYDLSDYDGQQVYIAVNVVSEDAFIFMLDDFAVQAETLLNWLSYSPAEAVIPAGGSIEVEIEVDTEGLEGGVYERSLRISSNDPANPQVHIPLTLNLTEVASLQWVNLQWPPSHSMEAGEEFTIYGQVYGEGITEDDEAHDDVRFWVGFHSLDSDPSTWPAENWIEGEFNESKGANDEYMATTGDHLMAGTYYYATRFQFGNEPAVYGGYHEEGGGFWEQDLNVSGVLEVVTDVNVDTDTELPDAFALKQNYPNPFNPTTQIQYALPEAVEVRLEVYNVMGQRVATLTNGMQNAGYHTVNFDATRLASGIYIYRLQAGSFVEIKKMTLVK